MNKWLLSGVLSLVLVLVAVALFLLLGPKRGVELGDGARGSNTPESTEELPDPALDAAGSNLGSADSTPSEEQVAANGRFLRGRVTEEGGGPLRGSRVMVLASGGMGNLADASALQVFRDRLLGRVQAARTGVVAEALTNEDGQYAIPLVSIPPGDYQVLAREEDHAGQWESWTWSSEPEELNFCLGLGNMISGRVLDHESKGIEGATVEAVLEDGGFGMFGGFGRRGGGGASVADRTNTNAEGYFRMTVAGGRYRITASASGFTRNSVESVDAGTQDVEIVLQPSSSIDGVVRDTDGMVVASARVALYRGMGGPGGFGGGGPGGRGGRGGGGGGPPARMMRIFSAPDASTVSNAEGLFSFGDLSLGNYVLLVEKASYVPGEERVEVETESGATGVDVTLEDGHVIEGVVTDPDQRPVRGAFVVVAEAEAEGGRGMQGRQGGRGQGGPGGQGGQGRRGGQARNPEGATADGNAAAAAVPETTRPEPLNAFQILCGAETDASGKFRVDTLRPGKYTLGVQAKGFPPYRHDDIEVAEEPVRVEVALEAGITIEGLVLSTQGEAPIPKAKVILNYGRGDVLDAMTDEKGHYSIAGLSAGRLEEVRVDARGYALLLANDVEIPASPATQTKDFQLDPAASIAGFVTDTKGTPVINARVSAMVVVEEDVPEAGAAEGGGPGNRRGGNRGGDPRAEWQARMRQFSSATSTRTDGEGKFLLAEVNPAPLMQISVSHPDFKPHTSDAFELKPGERTEGLQFQLLSGSRVEAWVQAPNGAPVAGVRLSLSPKRDATAEGEGAEFAFPGGQGGGRGRGGRGGNPFGGFGTMRSTGPDGKAVFTALDPGLFVISGAPREYQPFFQEVAVLEEQTTKVSASLLPENAITGTVKDRLGVVVEGASVEATLEGEGDRPRQQSGARSDAEGLFRVGSLGDGPYALRVRCEGFSEKRIEGVEVNRDIEIVLDRLGGIAGWVVTLETSEPVGEFTLRLVDPTQQGRQDNADPRFQGGPGGGGPGGRGGGGERRQSFRDPAGAFAFQDVVPGNYVIQASASGHTPAEVQVAVQEGTVTEGVKIALRKGISIQGVAVLEGSVSPVVGARVSLVTLREKQAEAGTEAKEQTSEQRREERRAQMEARRQSRGDAGQVARDLSQAMQGQLATAGFGRGRGGRGGNVTTDDTGGFELKDVPGGMYMIVVEHDELVPARSAVAVEAGVEPAVLRLSLKRGEELSGEVSLASGEAAVGATVMLQGADGTTKRTTTDDSGRYVLRGLEEGSYTVNLRGTGNERSRNNQVKVSKGSNRQDFELGEATQQEGR